MVLIQRRWFSSICDTLVPPARRERNQKKEEPKKKNPVRQNSVNPCGRFVAVVAILSADALTATAANRPNSTKKSSFAYYDVIFAGAVANRPRPQGTKEGGGRGVFICIL